MKHTAAIYYHPDSFDTARPRLMGRQSAGEGFLRALSRHGKADDMFCHSANRGGFVEFSKQVRGWAPDANRELHWIPTTAAPKLAQPGALFRPDPIIAGEVWRRRAYDRRGYSICGITHTSITRAVMNGLCDLLIAPVQPWDSIICTSTAVRSMVTQLLNDWAEYLAQRLGGKPRLPLQMPIIPLGVECAEFLSGDAASNARHSLREELGIGPDDLVILFVGRLVFQAKANPVPMYMAAGRAAATVRQKVHLVEAGWFEEASQEREFREAAARFCPNVTHAIVDGRDARIRREIWTAADVFISLSDNIQETFGLTPIEAMAAGLPCVVSDWDGYKESVREGVDGYRIPTTMPPPGCGVDFALLYGDDKMSYGSYVGGISLSTAVDVPACAAALSALLASADLRARMGAAARLRAREVFDWSVIVAAYEDHWAHLAAMRASSPIPPAIPRGKPLNPRCDDPYRVLRHYPTRTLRMTDLLELGEMAVPDHLAPLRASRMTNGSTGRRLSAEATDRLLDAIRTAGRLSVSELLECLTGPARPGQPVVLRTLTHLLKFDVLRFAPPAPARLSD